MTREEAEAEAARSRAAHPDASFVVAPRAGGWCVARLGVTPSPPTGTAIKPPPRAPQSNPLGGKPDPNWGIG